MIWWVRWNNSNRMRKNGFSPAIRCSRNPPTDDRVMSNRKSSLHTHLGGQPQPNKFTTFFLDLTQTVQYNIRIVHRPRLKPRAIKGRGFHHVHAAPAHQRSSFTIRYYEFPIPLNL